MKYAAVLIILILSFSIFNFVSAQSSPEFLVSWKAGNYVPSWYEGKVLPVVGALVDVNFELINAGKIVDLSQNTIRWYLNDELVKNESDGLGIKSLRVIVPNGGSGEISVRITIIDHVADILDKTIIIPVVRPEAILDSPYSNNGIRAGQSIFRAIPFFFNVSNVNNLSVSWTANGIKSGGAGENPWQLDLNLTNPQAGTEINLNVLIKNLLNYLELGNQNIVLRTK